MEYKVIFHNHMSDFQDIVNSHLADGWKLAGGLSIVGDLINGVTKTRYYQAVYRELE